MNNESMKHRWAMSRGRRATGRCYSRGGRKGAEGAEEKKKVAWAHDSLGTVASQAWQPGHAQRRPWLGCPQTGSAGGRNGVEVHRSTQHGGINGSRSRGSR
jgi:hypothetical protein